MLDLRASSVCFMPGSPTAMLVVDEDGPALLDLTSVPECTAFCASVAAGGTLQPHAQRPLDPAASMWLGPSQRRASLPPPSRAPTPARDVDSAAAVSSSDDTSTQQQEHPAGGGSSPLGAEHALGTASPEGDESSSDSCGWPAHQLPHDVPPAAVAVRFAAPAANVDRAVWDEATQAYVYRFAGHCCCVTWAAGLACGLRVLSTGGDGRHKLWDAASGEGCCTLVPPWPAGEEPPRVAYPVPLALAPLSDCVVVGHLSGQLCCWHLRDAARHAHVPPPRGPGNAAAACRDHDDPVTSLALAEGPGGVVLAAGDAVGRLLVRWL